jgi:hypothetical protein
LNFNFNSQIAQVWLHGTFNGEFYTNSGLARDPHLVNASYKFDNGYRIGVNGGFTHGRDVMLQGKDNYWVGAGC